jgi:nucleoside-diphosphate-sugar epimerase
MDWNGKTVLITGGTGFIGSHLAERLHAKGAIVRIPYRQENPWRTEHAEVMDFRQGDIADTAFVDGLMEGVDHVFHLASFRRNIAYHQQHIAEVAEKNVQMAKAVAGAVRRHPVPVTFFSTANIPPDARSDTRTSTDGYQLGKALCEEVFTNLASDAKIPLLCVRPVSVYGPRDKFSKDSNVVPALITRAAAEENTLTVWGSGKQHRKFVFVTDVIDATLALLDAGATGVQYVSPPDTIAIAELAAIICRNVHPDLALAFDTTKPEGPHQDTPLPLHPCLTSFPWKALESGIAETIAWWKKQPLQTQ